jgi:hypothetical protein
MVSIVTPGVNRSYARTLTTFLLQRLDRHTWSRSAAIR